MCWGQNNSSGVAGRNMLNAQLGKLEISSLQSYYYWSSTSTTTATRGTWASTTATWTTTVSAITGMEYVPFSLFDLFIYLKIYLLKRNTREAGRDFF